jgi:hypothetical protein
MRTLLLWPSELGGVSTNPHVRPYSWIRRERRSHRDLQAGSGEAHEGARL